MTQDERDWIKEMNSAHLDSIKELREKVGRLEIGQAVTSTKMTIYIAIAVGLVEFIEHLIFHK